MDFKCRLGRSRPENRGFYFAGSTSGDVSLTDLRLCAVWEGFFMSAMGISAAFGLSRCSTAGVAHASWPAGSVWRGSR